MRACCSVWRMKSDETDERRKKKKKVKLSLRKGVKKNVREASRYTHQHKYLRRARNNKIEKEKIVAFSDLYDQYFLYR